MMERKRKVNDFDVSEEKVYVSSKNNVKSSGQKLNNPKQAQFLKNKYKSFSIQFPLALGVEAFII